MSAEFARKYPFADQAMREFVGDDDENGLGFASAWLLHAVDQVLELDRTLTPPMAVTPEMRKERGRAIIELGQAYSEYNRAVELRHVRRGENTLH